ncbi:MAG: DNA/RNA non-specific endonuclease [Myxococcales bacterium]|nr:DNA/RNA non-specific endonuclease [Myxococcales bacterium]
MPSLPRRSVALLLTCVSWWSCGVDDVDAIVRVDDEPRATSSSGGRVEAVDAGVAVAADAGRVTLPQYTDDAGTGSNAGPSTIAFDAGPADAGKESDAGAPVTGFDAGPPDVDAGRESDAGAPAIAFDAGPPEVDAGRESDAGAPVIAFDAGRSDVDAGFTLDAGPVDAGAGAALSVHTALGLPDTSAVGAVDRWLLVKPQFVVSYDTIRKTPRWVSWRLDTSWLGTATRASSFRRDAQLPTTAGQARDEDFRNSGFERGHLCPSADRTNTDPDNDATFVFTNVVPQTRASNGGTWATLEDEARDQVRLGKTVFLVAGPVFGVTSQFVGAGVPVPTATFKVAVVVDSPAASVTTSTRVIGVLVPNTTSVSGNWRAFRVSVRSLEQATGFDFLADVPRAVQDVVETRVDAEP